MTGVGSEFGCSFAVITVVPEAHVLFRRAVGDPAPEEANGYYWTVVELQSSDGKVHRVVEGQAPERSHLPAVSFAALVLRTWRPRTLLVADCGGGIWGDGDTPRDGVALGDVVVSTQLYYYELQKLVPSGDGGPSKRVERAATFLQPSTRLSALARDLDSIDPDWRDTLQVPRPNASTSPTLTPGEIVCGDKLLADDAAPEVDHIITRYDKALAVDMETVGVARAAFDALDDGLAVNLLALRGISDWMDGKDNQATRDDWKPAACDAAVAAALALIKATPAVISAEPHDAVESRAELKRQLTSSYRVPKRPYDSVIRIDDEGITRNDLLAVAVERHGAVLIGHAGIGKSSAVHHAMLSSLSPLEHFPVLVDLKRWKTKFGSRLSSDPTGEDLLPSLDALLRASVQRIGVRLLEQIAQQRDVLLVVDGLNEVPFAETGGPILTLLEEYMRDRPRVRVLVTDRTANPFYAENGWTVLELQQLEVPEVLRVLDEELGIQEFDVERNELLRTPFYLNQAVELGSTELGSRASVVSSFFSSHLGADPYLLDRLAEMAYRVYTNQRERSFSESQAKPYIGVDVLASLRTAGVVVGEGDALTFNHQLVHDYLAARQLASDAKQWTFDVFDAVTFDAASFDVMGFALEQLTSADDRDAFVRRLYDWNWRGTITAMATAEQDGSSAASPPLRTALLAVIAEKKFDPVVGTSGRAVSQLERFPGVEAAEMARAVSLGELINLIAAAPMGSPWFETWRAVFCHKPGDSFAREDVELIADRDPVVAWTAANVARRATVGPELQRAARELYSHHPSDSEHDRALRWRVVHALGAWPEQENVPLLVDALTDRYPWVPYGAMRSLIEIAAHTPNVELREEIFAAIKERLTDVPAEALTQLAWAPLRHGTEDGFAAALRPLLDDTLAIQSSSTDQRAWTARIERFDEFWRQDLRL
jgi:nucleoside phosphorylase